MKTKEKNYIEKSLQEVSKELKNYEPMPNEDRLENIDVPATLQQMDCNPVKILAEIAKDPFCKEAVRINACKYLLDHISPKKKAVDINSISDNRINITIHEFKMPTKKSNGIIENKGKLNGANRKNKANANS